MVIKVCRLHDITVSAVLPSHSHHHKYSVNICGVELAIGVDETDQ